MSSKSTIFIVPISLILNFVFFLFGVLIVGYFALRFYIMKAFSSLDIMLWRFSTFKTVAIASLPGEFGHFVVYISFLISLRLTLVETALVVG